MTTIAITLIVSIIFSSWLLLKLDQQQREVLALKTTITAYQKDFKASQKDLTSCKEDIEFMKQGLEDIISIKEGKLK